MGTKRRVAKKREKEQNPEETKLKKLKKPKPPRAKIAIKKAYQEPVSGPKHLRGEARPYRVMLSGIEIAKSTPDDPALQAVFSKGFNVSANKKNYGYPLEFKQETVTFVDPKDVSASFCKMLDTLGLKMQAVKVETRYEEREPFTCIRLFVHQAKLNPVYRYVAEKSDINPGYGDSVRTAEASLVLDFQKSKKGQNALEQILFKDKQNILTITSINHCFNPPMIASRSYEVSDEFIKVDYENLTVNFESSVLYSMYCALRDDIDDRLYKNAVAFFDGRVTDMYLPAQARS
jgi:hypothetical protein